MITKITFRVLSEHREKIKTIPIEHPKFKVIPASKFLGIDLPAISIESQVIEYLDNIDKAQLMIDNNWDLIIDYYPPKREKTCSEEIDEFLQFSEPYLQLFPTIRRPFSAVVYEAKDQLFGRKKSNDTKFKEVLDLISMCNKAAEGTIQMIINSTKKYIE